MDYKKLIKSRKVRIAILQLLSFVPDRTMLRLQYRIKTGRRLNLKQPVRFSEKLQWYKLYDRNPLMKQCVDKHDVRAYVEQCGLADILNEEIGVYNSPKEIDYARLPQSFVLKDTLGGGGNAVILVPDKSKVDWEQLCRQMQQWVNTPVHVKHPGREWVYDGRRHRIIVEKYLCCKDGDLPDYKFFCFDGKVYCLYLMRNYTKHHEQGEMGYFDRNFEKLDVRRADFKPISDNIFKPLHYEEMVTYAEILSKEFPHVRVDFYNIDGKIIFGEMTFFMASGYMTFEPDSFDYEMGKQFVLHET